MRFNKIYKGDLKMIQLLTQDHKDIVLEYLEKYHIILNGGQLNTNPPKLIRFQETKFLDWQ